MEVSTGKYKQVNDNRMKTFNKQDLKDIVQGACFLASGGGGTYKTGMQMADYFDPSVHGGRGVEVVSIEEAMRQGKGKYGVVTAVMGAPKRMEGVKDARMNVTAVEKLAELCGVAIQDIGYVLPVEIGAISTMAACLTAAEMGIPVVDADGAGRAVPKLNMTTFAVQGADVDPTVLVSESGEYVALNISGGAAYSAANSIESLARPILAMPCFGQMGALAIWLVKTEEFAALLPIRGTLTKCHRLGGVLRETVQEARQTGKLPLLKKVTAVLQEIGYPAGYLTAGKLCEAANTTSGGFDNGFIRIRTSEGQEMKIIFQNESLLLWDSTRPEPVVIAPDLITCLIVPERQPVGQWVYSNGDLMDAETGQLRKELKNADIQVVGMRAPDELREQADKLEHICLNAPEGVTVSLPNSYKSMLEELGFYGKYVALK